MAPWGLWDNWYPSCQSKHRPSPQWDNWGQSGSGGQDGGMGLWGNFGRWGDGGPIGSRNKQRMDEDEEKGESTKIPVG